MSCPWINYKDLMMFSEELKTLLLRVITSWQVIAVTVVLVLYFFLVSYVARLYHSPRSPLRFAAKPKKVKEAAPEPESAEEGEAADDEDLGLDDE
jgi:flagellar biosynthesis/type III secretory pathway M-ring protein FliF/YscJ